MFEEVILVGNKCDFDKERWEVDTHTGEEVNINMSSREYKYLLYS